MTPSPPRPTRVRFAVLARLGTAAAIAYLGRNGMAVAEGTIRHDVGLTKAEIGFPLGPAFVWPYALLQIPLGWVGERLGPRVWPHNPQGPVSTAASLESGFSQPGYVICETVGNDPFRDDDSIDFASLERQINWAFAAGADGSGTGTVSELLRLTFRERVELTHKLGELNRGRGAFVAGVGVESTRQALGYAREAEAAGASAVMAIPPMSSRLPAEQVLDYFTRLAEGVGIPVIVQDASGYVGPSIPMAVNVELVRRFGPGKILFKSEANPIGPNLSVLRDATEGRARIFEGSGGIALVGAYRRGIAGTMPGTEFVPAVVALWRALGRGDEAATYRLYLPLCAPVALQLQAGLDGFLATEKYILHQRGLFATDRRRPPVAWSLDDETRREVDRPLALLGAAVTEANSLVRPAGSA